MLKCDFTVMTVIAALITVFDVCLYDVQKHVVDL